MARFYVKLDSMSLPASEQFQHFIGLNGSGQPQFRIVFAHNMAMNEDRVYVEARRDNGTFASTEGVNELVIPSGWHAIEVDWTAASSGGANDGSLVVCLDDDGSRMSCEQLTSIDNDQGRVQTVQWGAQEVGDTTAGSVDLDDFDSRRQEQPDLVAVTGSFQVVELHRDSLPVGAADQCAAQALYSV